MLNRMLENYSIEVSGHAVRGGYVLIAKASKILELLKRAKTAQNGDSKKFGDRSSKAQA